MKAEYAGYAGGCYPKKKKKKSVNGQVLIADVKE
jgi:hypothetical protein